MKEQLVTFPSGSITLEGLFAQPGGAGDVRGGVVCHPHPLYGGSMYNNVVDAALDALWKAGRATLRFNFRGVGGSGGEHSGGDGEADDAVAAMQFLTSQPGVQSRGAILAGYSFGAMAALGALAQINDLDALVLIALPIRMADISALGRFGKPIILAAGDSDAYCAARDLERLQKQIGSRAQLRIIEGADHFFGGYEEELSLVLGEMLKLV